MLYVKNLIDLVRINYPLGSQAKLCLKVKGDRRKYPLNGLYQGYLESGTHFVAFHNQSDSNPISVTDLLSYPFTGNELLIYNNSVECNLITGIKIEKNSVILAVDIFDNIVR